MSSLLPTPSYNPVSSLTPILTGKLSDEKDRSTRLISVSSRHRLGTNYQQLPVNAPKVPIANFQRDGAALYISQGSRPNYQSSLEPLTFDGAKGTLEGGARDVARESAHENFVGAAFRDLGEITERE